MDDGERREPHRRQCTAMAKSTGRRCRNAPSAGCTTCRMHGSGTELAKLAGARRAAEAEAARLLQGWTPPANGHPVDVVAELAKLAARLVSLSNYLTQHLAQLDAGQWAAPDEVTLAKLAMWHRAAADAGGLLTSIARLGIDLDRAELERRLAGILVYLLPRLSRRFGIPHSRGDDIGDAIAEEIRAVPPRCG